MSNCPIREINRLTKHTLQGVPTYTRSQKSAFSGLCVCYKWVWLVTKFLHLLMTGPTFSIFLTALLATKVHLPIGSHLEAIQKFSPCHENICPFYQQCNLRIFMFLKFCNFSWNFIIMIELILPKEKSKIGSETHDTRDLNLLQPFNHISPKRLFGVKPILI